MGRLSGYRALCASLIVVLGACTPSASPTPNATAAAPAATSSVLATTRPTPTVRPSSTAKPTPKPPVLEARLGAVGTAGCDGPAVEAGDTSVDLRVRGEARTALLHVPLGATAGVPLPLVLAFHGAFADGAGMAELTGFSKRADSDGFIVAYPNAVGDRLAWNTPELHGRADDVAFERALVDHLERQLCVDQHRVYAAGFSMGGAMAQLAACRDARIVAIAMVAAVHGKAGTTCRQKRPVPAVSMHGLLDPVVPWRGGLNPLPEFADHAPYRGVVDWASSWAVGNGCGRTPEEQEMIGGWVVPMEWPDCRAPVVVYRLNDGGHTWPGSAGPSVFGGIDRDIDATAVSVRFFFENALPAVPRSYEDAQLGFRVEIPPDWPDPWVGRYGYHQTLEGSVTFPVGKPAILDVWTTQLVLTSGSTRDGAPMNGASLHGRTAKQLARDLMAQVTGYALRDETFVVDGERALVLKGTGDAASLPLAAVFTHKKRAFLLLIYHELPDASNDVATMHRFLSGLTFTE